MEKKFEVGQVWRNRMGDTFRIVEIRTSGEHPVKAKDPADCDESFTMKGFYYSDGDHDEMDLLELVTNADGTAAGITLTHEPVSQDNATFGEPLAARHGIVDTSRTEFIDKLTHDLFTTHAGIMYSEGIADHVRAAVKLRDELVGADVSESVAEELRAAIRNAEFATQSAVCMLRTEFMSKGN